MMIQWDLDIQGKLQLVMEVAAVVGVQHIVGAGGDVAALVVSLLALIGNLSELFADS